ncbi:UNVERIFIED_CONTAM: hypothetical protein HDU68_004309 [Siphonaria sp. JEL0065]|nr:hypothetical protein HDU68_004309 [Siphonaria sp. JEL0065]
MKSQKPWSAAISAPVTTVVLLFGLTATVYLYFIRKGPVFSAGYKFLGLNPPPKPTIVGFTARIRALEPLLAQAFAEGIDLGSQFSLYVKGELKADIATGFTNRTFKVPYAQDTLQLVFSSSKLVTSSIIAHLTGRLSFDDKISKYWPEFAQGGKENVTVAQFLSHRGGVAFLDPERVPTPEDLVDLDLLANKIAGQPHNFDGKEIHPVTPNKPVASRLALLDGYTPMQKMFFVIVPEFVLRWFRLLPVPKTLINVYLHKNTPQHKSLFKSGPDFTELLRKSEFSETKGLLSPSVFRESFKELGTQHDLVMAKPASFIQLGIVFSEKDLASLENAREYGVSIAYTNNFCHLQSVGDERNWRLFEELIKIIKRDDPDGLEKVQKATSVFLAICGGED